MPQRFATRLSQAPILAILLWNFHLPTTTADQLANTPVLNTTTTTSTTITSSSTTTITRSLSMVSTIPSAPHSISSAAFLHDQAEPSTTQNSAVAPALSQASSLGISPIITLPSTSLPSVTLVSSSPLPPSLSLVQLTSSVSYNKATATSIALQNPGTFSLPLTTSTSISNMDSVNPSSLPMLPTTTIGTTSSATMSFVRVATPTQLSAALGRRATMPSWADIQSFLVIVLLFLAVCLFDMVAAMVFGFLLTMCIEGYSRKKKHEKQPLLSKTTEG